MVSEPLKVQIPCNFFCLLPVLELFLCPTINAELVFILDTWNMQCQRNTWEKAQHAVRNVRLRVCRGPAWRPLSAQLGLSYTWSSVSSWKWEQEGGKLRPCWRLFLPCLLAIYCTWIPLTGFEIFVLGSWSGFLLLVLCSPRFVSFLEAGLQVVSFARLALWTPSA